MKPVILFVDDDRAVLDGLRRQLRRQRDLWDLRFVASGAAALGELTAGDVDVLVSDLRMPGMDGIELLERARAAHPGVIRVVLSGYADPRQEKAAFQVAHRFIPKPCDHSVLVAVLSQACAARALVADPHVHRLVGRIERLPAVPRIFSQLALVLEDDRSDAADVARVIERDAALVAAVLRVANSPMFAPADPVARVRDAVAYLGRRMVSNLVLGVSAFDSFAGTGLPTGFMRLFQANAMAAGNLVARLAERRDRDDAFVAGMLHDIGQLVMLVEFGEPYRALVEERREGTSLVASEAERYGTSHDRVGAYLLGLWGLPARVVEVVAHHHGPLGGETSGERGLGRPVRLAQLLLERVDDGGRITIGDIDDWDLSVTERDRAQAWLLELLPRANEGAVSSVVRRPMTRRRSR